MRRTSIVFVAAALGLAGCGSSASTTATTTGSTTASQPSSTASSAPATGASGCRTVPIPTPKGPQHLTAPTLRLDPAKTYTVHVTTNCGAFSFTLDVRQSPKTSASIVSLVQRGFYDNLVFHRIVPGFVIQGGDPLGTGLGGPGYTVVEPPPANTQYVEGDVAMAKTEAQPSGASGSQFFIVTGANVSRSDGLTPVYALAGKVVSGLNVVLAIGRLPTNANSYPTPPVVMSNVTVSVS